MANFNRLTEAWRLPTSAATPHSAYLNRRAIVRGMGLGAMAAAAPGLAFGSAGQYPAPTNPAFATADLPGQSYPITSEEVTFVYNNYYEFFEGYGTSKNIWREAQKMPLRPWTVVIDGLVEQEKTWDIDALIKAMPLEERVYRHRCVETWAMTVPWTGFPMAELVKLAKPFSSAKYLKFETFDIPRYAPGQKNREYPWPYIEGMTVFEAMNDLAFMATGVYGKELPVQMGAPMRLALPWKYGFKSSKGLVRITFTDEQPVSFWEHLNGDEYGFWANINPAIHHPRWSQARERDIGTGEERASLLFNGYTEQVGDLYKGLGKTLKDKLYR